MASAMLLSHDMAATDDGLFDALETWSSPLFVLAGFMLLIAAANRGLPLVIDTYTFNDWIGLTVVLGRLAALLGTLGLSGALVRRTAKLGKRSRQIAVLANVFAVGLLVMAVLENAGVSSMIIAVFGFGTFLLSLLTFSLFGVGILRTKAYANSVGILLLIVAVSLLVVFFGQQLFAEEVVGTVIEALLFVLYVVIGLLLRTHSAQHDASATADARA